ncbi:MAG: SDR family NAD(P)-dependent oxidoreductase, partial [Halioglobus sp.]|nr:SDR family NAD(P)-dependent oxidoreductase [Halioglobus sp.]
MIRLLFTFLLLTGGLAHASEQPTVLVTGANRGIGLELATQLKASGYNVIATARKPDQAPDLQALDVRVEQLDVTDAASVAALVERLGGAGIDLLINNAGVGGDGADSI